MAAVNEMRLPDFSVCLQAQAGIMPLKGKCIPRVQRVVLIYLLGIRVYFLYEERNLSELVLYAAFNFTLVVGSKGYQR